MRAVPMLVVKSTVPCLLFANNAPAGEISNEHPAGLPMPETGRCYIHYVPLAQGRLPGAFRLDFDDGELTTPANDLPARVVRWPRGVVEAEIVPENNPGPGFVPLAPDTLAHINLRHNCRAYILRYVAYWLVVEADEGHTLLSIPLPGGSQPELSPVDLNGREAVAARAQGDAGDWVVIAANNGGTWQELFRLTNGQVDVAANGDVTSLVPLNDTAGHAVLTSWVYSNGQYTESRTITWLDGEPRVPQGPEEAARAFLEAWQLGQSEEATAYLSAELRTGLTAEDIGAFLGNYDRVEPARFSPPTTEGEVALALIRREGNGMLNARPVAVRMVEEEAENGKWKVDNIRVL